MPPRPAPTTAAFAVALPVAAFLVLVGALQTRLGYRRLSRRFAAAAAVVIGLAAIANVVSLPPAVVGMGVVLAVLAVMDVVDAHRRLRAAPLPDAGNV